MFTKPVRYQHQRCLHFITFSCYHRMELLNSNPTREIFEQDLERVRRWYGCSITAYVIMPEHVHLLISEPERSELSLVIQMLKQVTSANCVHPRIRASGKCVTTTSPSGPKPSASRSCVISTAIQSNAGLWPSPKAGLGA